MVRLVRRRVFFLVLRLSLLLRLATVSVTIHPNRYRYFVLKRTAAACYTPHPCLAGAGCRPCLIMLFLSAFGVPTVGSLAKILPESTGYPYQAIMSQNASTQSGHELLSQDLFHLYEYLDDLGPVARSFRVQNIGVESLSFAFTSFPSA